MFEKVKEKTMCDLHEGVAEKVEERRRYLIKREFDVITNFGSKITRYICVLVSVGMHGYSLSSLYYQ